ncbi:hypothetical protein [Burkholderia vietnamiensis]|uniref:hypothetical protein n=1 Tax=Burkholderia vietnamiensis TaxID=60552 RepID=UPI001CF5BA48|nr:hypothetical protein [Burkholderia vietnamiensis]MCA8228323.1 hypothetical protein [Burkholderia vietnamiensis]
MSQSTGGTPRHGEKRNQRWIRETHAETDVAHAVTGQSMGTFSSGSSRKVDERWCATCNDWVDTSKIGFLDLVFGCPTCKTRW